MRQHFTKFELKARYFQLGEVSEQTKNLIFVIHGYGQQAKYFIQKFESLDNTKNCIVAPEGLNRFYLEGFSGRVGATWMTKEDRLTDIENYLTYLNKVYEEVIKDTDTGHLKVTVIGFSQGSATASRWVSNTPYNVHQLILWAGIFPPDLDYQLAGDKFDNMDIKYVYGLKDPFLTEGRIDEMNRISSKLQVSPETITFDGEHIIDGPTLQTIFKS